MIENAKLKRSFDKAASEASDYKKKYNATLSEQEKASLEKAEADYDTRLSAFQKAHPEGYRITLKDVHFDEHSVMIDFVPKL